MLSDEEPLSSLDGVLGSSESGQLTEGSPSGGSMRRDRWRVPLPPHLHGKAPRKHWNANALAFLGDSVWEVSGVGGSGGGGDPLAAAAARVMARLA